MLPCICGTYWHGYTPRFASFHRQYSHGNISSSFQHIRASGLADRPIPCLPLVTRQTHAYTFQDIDQRVKKSGSTSGTAQTDAKGGPPKESLVSSSSPVLREPFFLYPAELVAHPSTPLVLILRKQRLECSFSLSLFYPLTEFFFSFFFSWRRVIRRF